MNLHTDIIGNNSPVLTVAEAHRPTGYGGTNRSMLSKAQHLWTNKGKSNANNPTQDDGSVTAHTRDPINPSDVCTSADRNRNRVYASHASSTNSTSPVFNNARELNHKLQADAQQTMMGSADAQPFVPAAKKHNRSLQQGDAAPCQFDMTSIEPEKQIRLPTSQPHRLTSRIQNNLLEPTPMPENIPNPRCHNITQEKTPISKRTQQKPTTLKPLIGHQQQASISKQRKSRESQTLTPKQSIRSTAEPLMGHQQQASPSKHQYDHQFHTSTLNENQSGISQQAQHTTSQNTQPQPHNPLPYQASLDIMQSNLAPPETRTSAPFSHLFSMPPTYTFLVANPSITQPHFLQPKDTTLKQAVNASTTQLMMNFSQYQLYHPQNSWHPLKGCVPASLPTQHSLSCSPYNYNPSLAVGSHLTATRGSHLQIVDR